MKRSIMKSEIAVQPRCRPEGRIFPRRKVASKSHLLNGSVGDFEMELSLAIQESLKYARQQDGDLCQGGSVNSDVSLGKSELCNSVTKDDKGLGNTSDSVDSSAPMASLTANEEVGRLKDLLLAQAELIQCQQEEIVQKNKELQVLRMESDTLQCRLERMERRLSILKQKEESHEPVPSKHGGNLKLKSNSLSICHSSDLKRKNESHKQDFKRKRKRGHRLTPMSKTRRRWQKLSKSASAPTTSAQSDNEDGAESDEDGGDSSDEESASGDEKSENESADDKSHKSDEENESEDNSPKNYIDYPILQTETMYHLYYPKHLCPSPDAKKIQEKSTLQIEVETPSWRLRPLTNMYQLEGTENITDEAYYKRHQKFEMEEKRRKRWDLQRIRELRMFEKFQRQKETEILASQDEVDVETFLPSIHNLTHIEISETVPVMAFGQPIPYVSPGEFEIPWEMSTSGPSVSNSSRHRANSSHSSRRH